MPRACGTFDRMPTARMRGLMTKASAAGLGLVFLIALAVPAAAGAEERTETYRTGPIQVAGYQVKQDQTFGVPKPDVDGYITRMEVDLVDANGRQVPISRLMLHHIVFANAGANFGDKRDATCDTFTMLDSQTKLPALAERFYGAGEERAKLALPRGHGYETKKDDGWFMTWMAMNHRRTQDRASIH